MLGGTWRAICSLTPAKSEIARTFCMEFPDGSGLFEWPIDDAWQPPAAIGDDPADGPSLPVGLLVLLIGSALIIGASVVVFRRGPA